MPENVKPVIKEEKVWNREFTFVFLTSMFLNSAFWTIVPMVSSYCIELGADLKTASFVVSLMSLAAMIVRPFAGMFCDQVNRKKIILFTAVFYFAMALLHTLANDIKILAACRILTGIAFSFASVAVIAFGSIFIPDSRLGEGMGWLSLGQVISQSLGPGIGVFLIEHYGYTMCFIGSAALALLAIFCILNVSPEEKKEKFSFKKFSFNDIIYAPVIPYALILAFFSACSGLDNTFVALIGKERSIANFSLFFTAYSIGMFVTRPPFGKILDKKGLDVMFYPALVAMCLTGIITGVAGSTIALIVSACFKAVGMSAGSQGIQSATVKKFGREHAGVISSTNFIGMDIGNVLSPILGSMVVEKYGYKTMYWGYGLLTFAAGLAIYLLIKVSENKNKEQ